MVCMFLYGCLHIEHWFGFSLSHLRRHASWQYMFLHLHSSARMGLLLSKHMKHATSSSRSIEKSKRLGFRSQFDQSNIVGATSVIFSKNCPFFFHGSKTCKMVGSFFHCKGCQHWWKCIVQLVLCTSIFNFEWIAFQICTLWNLQYRYSAKSSQRNLPSWVASPRFDECVQVCKLWHQCNLKRRWFFSFAWCRFLRSSQEEPSYANFDGIPRSTSKHSTKNCPL